jgi:hypothetical protein
MHIPLAPLIRTKFSEFGCRFDNRRNWLQQQLDRPQLAVGGDYHFGNLGDMALGYAVQRQAKKLNVEADLQCLYNLPVWPKASSIIVGGGAVAYGPSLECLKKVYGNHPERIAILGVDFNDTESVEHHRNFLNDIAIITCRSSNQVEKLRAMLGRADISWHQDLCFSYVDDMPAASMRRERIFGINTVPFMLLRSDRSFTPGASHMMEMRKYTAMLPHMEQLGKLYCDLVRKIVIEALKLNYQVVHFPFTPTDDLFARTVFRDLTVTYLPYYKQPEPLLLQMQRCERIFATRFHSLVFALLTETPFISFGYANKCVNLLSDLGLKETGITLPDLLGSTPAALADKVLIHEPGSVPLCRVQQAGREVSLTIQQAISRLQA